MPAAALPAASGHGVADDCGDASRRFADTLVGEMGVALGGGDIGVAEQPAYGVEAESAHHGVAGERVPAVVNAHVV